MKKISTLSILALLLGMFTLSSPALLAQATLSVQGVLTKSDGTAIDDGEYAITFRLWNAQSGGSTVHSETLSSVETIGGVYSVVLGLQTPINAAFDMPYYLGVSVGGGAELTPRPRLTHAPYALSLQGQNNKFPSVGTVLVDSINVAGGANIAGAASANSLAVTGTANIGGAATAGAFVAASGAPSGKGYSFGAGGDTDGGLFSTTDGTVSLFTNAGERVKVSDTQIELKGRVLAAHSTGSGGGYAFDLGPTTGMFAGFGLPQPALSFKLSNVDKIYIDGTTNTTTVSSKALFSNEVKFNEDISSDNDDIIFKKPVNIDQPNGVSYNVNMTSANTFRIYDNVNYDYTNDDNRTFSDVGLKVRARVLATAFIAYSDMRIKKDFLRVKPTEALSKIVQIQVTNYRYIDEIARGRGLKQGFLAQEVNKIEPAAITKSTDYIPDVYAPAAQIRQDSGRFVVSLSKPHGLQKGDKVRLFEGALKHDVTVESATETGFAVAPWAAAAPAQVFVYGKEVSDFMAVDYDHIFTMNVAATQELARRVELLEQENAALRAQNAALERKQNRFEKQLSDLGKRLELLELPSTDDATRD